MKVEQVMTREVATVLPSTPLKDVARLLVERNISGVPVVDRVQNVLGVVSETDILYKELDRDPAAEGVFRRLLGRSGRESSAKVAARTARDAMNSPAIGTSTWTSVAEAAALMVERGVDRLIVLDDRPSDDERLVGIVTKGDLVRAFARDDVAIAEEIRGILERDFCVVPGDVKVTVRGGEVAMAGRVDLKSNAEGIEQEVARIPGVVSLRAELEWQIDESQAMKSLDRTY
jgi:CBS domain-containing protein